MTSVTNPSRRLKTALFGCGRIGAANARDPVMARHFPYSAHSQVLATHPAIEWVAAVDPSAASLDALLDSWNVPRIARDVSQLEGSSEIELAVLATPPRERCAIVQALPSLRAVLVEKPLGMDTAEAKHFLDMCRDREIMVQVNLLRRGDRVLTEHLEVMRGTAGKVQAAFGSYGNGLLNNGTHLVDLIRMAAGEIAWVQSPASIEAPRQGPLAGDQDIAFVAGCAAGGTVMVQPLTQQHYREFGLDLWYTARRLHIAQGGLVLLEYPHRDHRYVSGDKEIASDAPQAHPTSLGTALHTLYQNLVDAVTSRAALMSPGDSAYRTAAVIEAIQFSCANEGKPVTPRFE